MHLGQGSHDVIDFCFRIAEYPLIDAVMSEAQEIAADIRRHRGCNQLFHICGWCESSNKIDRCEGSHPTYFPLRFSDM